MLAALRPDDWNLPLLLHVAGAAVLVGTVIVVAWALIGAARSSDGAATAALTRLGFRTLLIWGLPAYLVMRLAAQWVYSVEDIGERGEDPAWIGVGFAVSELGLLLLIVVAVLTGIAGRRLREDPDARPGLVRAGAALTTVLLVLYVVAVWAMTAKPT